LNKYVQPLVSAPMLYNADWLAWNTRLILFWVTNLHTRRIEHYCKYGVWSETSLFYCPAFPRDR